MQIPVLKKIIAKLNLVHILVKIWEIIYAFAEGDFLRLVFKLKSGLEISK